MQHISHYCENASLVYTWGHFQCERGKVCSPGHRHQYRSEVVRAAQLALTSRTRPFLRIGFVPAVPRRASRKSQPVATGCPDLCLGVFGGGFHVALQQG